LEFRPVIHRHGAWAWRPVQGSIEDLADRLTRHPKTGLSHRTVVTPDIDDRQDPKRPSIGQGILHKIHTPPLRRSCWRWSGTSVQRDVLASPHPHAQLHAIESVQSSDALPIHPPAFPTQHHPDPQIPQPGSGMSQIANAHPQRGLILRAAASIQAARLNWANRQARTPLT